MSDSIEKLLNYTDRIAHEKGRIKTGRIKTKIRIAHQRSSYNIKKTIRHCQYPKVFIFMDAYGTKPDVNYS